MIYSYSPRLIVVVLAIAGGLWAIGPFQAALSPVPSDATSESQAVVGEAAAVPALDSSLPTEAAAGVGEPLSEGEQPAKPEPIIIAQAIVEDSAAKPAPAAVPAAKPFSFAVDRPLLAPEQGADKPGAERPTADAPAAPATPALASPALATPALATPALASASRDTGAAVPSFADQRPLPQSEPNAPNAPAAGEAASSDTSRLPTAGAFQDTRPLPATSFRDERLVTPPSFQDNRPVGAPSFQDERLVEQPTFRDARPVVSQSFQDSRPLTELPAAAKTADQAAAALPAPVSSGAAPVSAAPQAGLPTLVAVSPSSLRLDGSSGCKEPDISTEALDGGRMKMRIVASCHPGGAVQISYGGAEFIRKLNAWGNLDFILDCFAGASSAAELRFADGMRRSVPVAANDLDKVSKIAIVWRAAANLDLHVFEYGARDGEPGHIWAKSASSIASARLQADKRGHGVLATSDDGETLGDKVEVYTFLHNDAQDTGAISMALDYESRGDKPSGATCGAGALAEVDFQVSILPRNGQVSRQTGVLTRVECGTVIAREARFNQSALPVLRIKK